MAEANASTINQARDKGREHGKTAAGLVLDGNATEYTYRRLKKGIEDGDPEVLDWLPCPDMTGNYGDAYSLSDLRRDFPDRTENICDLADAYEEGWNDGLMTEVIRICNYHLEGDNE